MESLELNKIAAAILTAGIAFSVCGLVGETLVHPTLLTKSAITMRGPRRRGSAAPQEDPPIAALLASADPKTGQALTQRVGCVACHSFNEGGKPGIGPNLYGVVGAPHGHEQGYAYSNALKSKQGDWTYDELNQWLKKPSAYAPGTKMSFAGLADPKQRADIIVYLHTLSANPVPFPPAPPPSASAAAAPGAAAAAPQSFETLLASADPKQGQADTLKQGCIACHTFNEGGKAGLGPNLYGVVGAPHGHMEGFSYSAALKSKQGPWTTAELNQWLTKPAAYAPGTKMTFAGISDPKVRADVISYLNSLSHSPEALSGGSAAAASGTAAAPPPKQP